MSVKLDPEHVVDFALQPVRSRPDWNRTGQGRAIQDLRLHPNALVARMRIKYPHHIELLLARWVMDGSDVHAIIKLLFIAQDLKNLRNQRAIDHHVILSGISQGLDAGTVVALEPGDHGGIPRSGSWSGGFRWRSRFRGRARCRSCRSRRGCSRLRLAFWRR